MPSPEADDVAALPPESYREGPYQVFTEVHHLRRGRCCGHGCRHCPFEPRACAGSARVRAEHQSLAERLR